MMWTALRLRHTLRICRHVVGRTSAKRQWFWDPVFISRPIPLEPLAFRLSAHSCSVLHQRRSYVPSSLLDCDPPRTGWWAVGES